MLTVHKIIREVRRSARAAAGDIARREREITPGELAIRLRECAREIGLVAGRAERELTVQSVTPGALPDAAPSEPCETSRDAAGAIGPKRSRLRNLVLGHIISKGEYGATDEEIEQALSMAGNTARARRWELLQAGLLFDSGRRRLTTSAHSAIVWLPTVTGGSLNAA